MLYFSYYWYYIFIFFDIETSQHDDTTGTDPDKSTSLNQVANIDMDVEMHSVAGSNYFKYGISKKWMLLWILWIYSSSKVDLYKKYF